MDTKLEIPYFSQFLDVETLEYRPRSCGMTCVRMALVYFGAKPPTIDEMVTSGMENGGYSKAGWIHDYLLKVFHSYGFGARRMEKMRDEDVAHFREAIDAGNPAIASVIRKIQDRVEFHMVLITGVRRDEAGKLVGLFYHDPAGRERPGLEHQYVALPDFLAEWRHMAIFPTRTN